MPIQHHVDLQNLNTFHLPATAEHFAEIFSPEELRDLITEATQNGQTIRVLGGGSNILFTQPAEGVLVRNRIGGICPGEAGAEKVQVHFGAGVLWHEAVMWAVEHNFGGIENLALIPGTIGAAPIQNIGAYGVELTDVFHSLEAMHLRTGAIKMFTHEACRFGYRDSVFKQEAKGQWCILSVALQLQRCDAQGRHPHMRVEYGDVKTVLEQDFGGEVNVRNVAEAVMRIRRSKLPDPAQIGNAGSFFKNPVIETTQYEALKNTFPALPSYPAANGVKVPAGWLIEQCGWKGFRDGECGVHERQALVLVNYGKASGAEILDLSDRIITSVQHRFNIRLEREVNIW